MNKVEIIKAQPMADQVEDVEIVISRRFEPQHHSLGKMTEIYEQEAKKLFDALYASLPGGTFDRLLGLMLAKKSSHLIISHAAYED